MRPRSTSVLVRLSDPTADTPVLDLLTQQLRRRLLTIEAGPAWRETDAARATVDLVDAGTMRVTLPAAPVLLGRLVEMVRAWVAREDRVAVTLEVDGARLTVFGAAAPQRAHSIDAWVARALGGARGDDTWLG